MPTVGVLQVDVTANTASFSGDLAKASKDVEAFGASASAAGEQVNYSMREARGGIALAGEELGVHIPRHIQTLIAEIPGIGVAFSTLLPILAVVFGAVQIYKWIEAADKAAAALDEGFVKGLEKTRTRSDELQVSIEKLTRDIDALEGIKNDGTALALAKAREEADKLATSLKKDLDAYIKLMDASAHGSFMTGLLGTSGAGQAADVAKKLKETLEKIPHDSDFAKNVAQAHVEAWKDAQSRIDKNNAATAKAKSHGPGDMGNMLAKLGGEAAIAKTNEDLQNFQVTLSETTGEMVRASKVDALQATKDGLVKAAEAAKQARDAQNALYNEQQKGLNRFESNERRYYKEHTAQVKKKADEDIKETEREAAEQMKATRSVNEQLEKEQAATQALSLSSRIAALAKSGDALKQQHDLGLISEREYAQKMIEIYKQEQAAKEMYSKVQIAQEADPDKKLKLQKQLTDETVRYNAELAKMGTALQKVGASWQQYFAKMKTETQDLSTQIRVGLQDSMDKFTKGFADSMSKAIVEGKDLGAATKQLGIGIVETMTSTMLQWLEEWVLAHTMARVFAATTDKAGQASAATLAGANMTASWAAAPFPIDALAPEMGLQAFATAMAFERGGIVPGVGPMPATVHGGETVVTKALTDRVSESEGKGRRGQSVNLHFHGIKDLDTFKSSESQLLGKQQNALDRAARRKR